MAFRRTWTVAILLLAIPAGVSQADPMQPTWASTADAYVDLGAGPYPDQSSVAAGSPQPWYDSSQVARLFGGTPTAQQQQAFDQAVMQQVQQTFQLSGISVSLTDNPNVSAPHTLSVVSNATSAPFPGAIGTTLLGQDGFSFIDVEAQAAQNIGQLETIVAHNVAHELMLAFGVGENYDKTGNYIDATSLNWATAINPNATFSAGAAQAIRTSLSAMDVAPVIQAGPQEVSPQPVPEPMTAILWGLAATAGLAARHRRGRRDRTAGPAEVPH